MAPPQELIHDAVAEILLRLPPSDPASLVRASAVCKPWLRALTDPAFLRRYRAFHGTPLVLGFLRNPNDRSLARFVPTSPFRPAAHDHRTCYVLDCRHGRALLYDYGTTEFVVWDPITGRERRIPDEVPDIYTNHSVLCAAGTGCDHSGCSGGPFLVASVGVFRLEFVQADACFISSEPGARMVHSNLYLSYDRYSLENRPAALVGDALYYIGSSSTLLRYDILGGRAVSVIKLPEERPRGTIVVMPAEDGELGFASLYSDSLKLWSRGTGVDGEASWVQRRVIDFKKLLQIDNLNSPVSLSGFAEGTDVVFVCTDDDCIFAIDLRSLQVKKVCQMDDVGSIFPYVSFYTPAACAICTLPSPVGTQCL